LHSQQLLQSSQHDVSVICGVFASTGTRSTTSLTNTVLYLEVHAVLATAGSLQHEHAPLCASSETIRCSMLSSNSELTMAR
jgi:hypothetical protein